MNLNNIPFIDLDEYPDNQFFSIEILDHRLIKKYEGQDWEKKLNLQNEYNWLKEAPTYLNYHFPKLLQDALDFKENDHSVELHLSKIDRKSLAQGILKGEINDQQALKYLDSALFILCEYIYPIHSEFDEFLSSHYYETCIEKFFNRTSLLDNFFRIDALVVEYPLLKEIQSAHKLVVNNIMCPSVNEIFNFINNKNIEMEYGTKLYTIHGNLNFENILVEPGGHNLSELISFINPLNSDQQFLYPEHFLGLPVIDFSNLLLNMECYVDEICHGGFHLESYTFGSETKINFQINTTYSSVYQTCLQFLHSKRSYFQELQGASERFFTIVILCSEWLLLFNKIVDLNSKNIQNREKVIVLYGILGLLGKRLVESIRNIDQFRFPHHRLEIR